MNNLGVVVRTGATAVLTGLAAVSVVYPHLTWIPVVYAVLGAVGIHAIPSVGQAAPVVPAVNLIPTRVEVPKERSSP